MTDVKICGLTRPEDVVEACRLGAAFLGFNFVASSPRRLTPGRARELARSAAPGVGRVGVFCLEDSPTIWRAVAEVPLDFVQLHRPVTREDLDGMGAGIFAAVRVEEGVDALPPPEVLSRCARVLWDSSAGKGLRPDWARVPPPKDLPIPVFVAGGLDAGSVGTVIQRFRPSGVDVATGVEIAPGIKDREKLSRFFAAVEEADREAS